MIENSRIISSIIYLYNIVLKGIRKSYAGAIYKKMSKGLSTVFNNSLIISFFSANWDEYICPTTSKLSQLTYNPLVTTGAKYRIAKSQVKSLVENSLFFSLVNQRFIFVLLCFIVFLIPFTPTMVLAGISAITLVVYILAILFGRIKIRKPKTVDFFMLLFGACFLYGTLSSYNFAKAVQIMILFGVFMMVYFIIAECIQKEEELNVLINALLISGTLVSLYGIYQYFTGVEMNEAWVDKENFENLKRVYATFGNPNVLGEYLIIITTLGLGMFWKEKDFIRKVFYLGIVAITSICLIMTGSRGAMIGIILAIGLFVILAEKRLLIVGIAGILMLPYILPESVWQRLLSVTDLSDSSSSYRISIYKASIQMIKTYWTTGIGVDSFHMVYPLYSLEAAYAYHSHNTFMQVLLELGIVGFTSFVGLLIFYFQKTYSTLKSSQRQYQILAGVMFGGFLGLLSQGIVDHIWFDYRIVLLFWVVMGIGMAVSEIGVDTKCKK